jgi:WD40 repeat protein
MEFSPDSKWFACNGADGPELRDARSGVLLKRMPLNQPLARLDISQDGRRIIGCGVEGRTMVWDAASGVPLFKPLECDAALYVQFSRDASRFLIFSDKPTARICETETGRQIGPTLTNCSRGVCAAFHPDGHSFVIGSDNGTIEFWSLSDGRWIENAARHKDVVWSARFSPDGKQLLTSSRDRTAALWDWDTRKLIREFRHDQQVYRAVFGPDGRRIVTGDASHKCHMWDVSTGQRLFSLPVHPGGVWYCEFSSDGQLLLTGDDAGNARLWEAATGLPLSGWVHNGTSLKSVHLSADGRMALSVANNGVARLWPIVRVPMPAPNWLPDLAEALAGRRLRDDGAPEIVPAEQWESSEASLSSQQGEHFYARWAHWFLVERLKERPTLFVP